MKMNEKGITLVELLGAMVLVSLVVGLAWSALLTGFKHTSVETTKTQLQQEANYAVSKMSNEHRKSDYYYLRYQNGKLEINTCKEAPPVAPTCSGFKKLTENAYSYSGTINGIQFADWPATTIIRPKKAHVNFIMKIADPANPKRAVEVNTTLTRILTNPN